MKKYIIFLITLISIQFLNSCNKETSNPVAPPTNNQNVVLKPDTKIINDNKNFNSATVDSDKVVLTYKNGSSLPSFNVGDIIIGKAGDGYLRKVQSVSTQGSTITLMTTYAALDEAFSKIDIDTSFTFSPGMQKLKPINYNSTINGRNGILNYKVTSGLPTMQINKETGQLNLVFPNMSFKINDPNSSDYFEITADTINFNATIELSKFVIHLIPSQFSLIYNVNVNREFDNIAITLRGAINQQFPDLGNEDLLLTDIYLGAAPIFPPFVYLLFYFNIGGGIFGEFSMGAGTNLISSMTTTSNYQVGAEFINGSWTGVWNKSTSGNTTVDFTPIADISGDAELFIKPKLKTKLGDIIGPDLFVRGFLYGEVNYPPLSVEAGYGLAGGLDFVVHFLSFNMVSFEWTLFEQRWPFWQQTYNLIETPILSSPTNGANNVSLPPTLIWNASSGATSYALQVSTDNSFTNLVFNQNELTGTSQQVNGLNNSTTYYWRVSASNSQGTSQWSSVWNFTSEAGGTAPLPPTLASPPNGATNVSLLPTLLWNASSGATSYALQVSTNNSFTNFVYNQSGLTGTSQQISGLSNSTTYYWRVNATNNYGTSDWSSVWSFTTESGGGGGEPCPGIPIVVYEGKTYNTVQIGTQCWLKENLDVGTRINGIEEMTDNGTIEKYCYDDDPANCDTYGGLYQWDETMQYVTTEGAQGICPPGWHLPTLDEFQTLSDAVGGDGNALKSIGQGSGVGAGTNTSGFSALLAGSRDLNGYFYNLGVNTIFLSSTEFNAAIANGLYLNNFDSSIYLGYIGKAGGFSVRCLKD